jgi:hypothetical protein
MTGIESALHALRERLRAAPEHPYPGLDAFRFADSGILAAREAEIERLVRLVVMYRGVLLYGESGAGKTSVVNAGLLPRLVKEGYWPHRVRVQPRAGGELFLEPILVGDGDERAYLPSAFAREGPDRQITLAASEFGAAVEEVSRHGRVVLVFDQFEELVTLCGDHDGAEGTQAQIVDAIVRLLRDARLRVSTIHRTSIPAPRQ